MNVIINEMGEILEIDPKEINEDSILVPLDGYYEVFNVQKFPYAKWDFELKKWVGFHKQIYLSGKWVEGASQEELNAIEAERINQLLTPSHEEVAKATREIETITLLTDLGVI